MLSQARKIFMEIFFIAAWNLWKQRNGKVFQNQTPSRTEWKRQFKKYIGLRMFTVNEDIRDSVCNWLEIIG